MIQVNPAYLHNNGQDALYARITPLASGISVPYWCNNFSAYNNAPPTGAVSLSDPMFAKALPVNAKYSAGMMIQDITAGQPRPLDYYGTVFSAGGKIIQFDPGKMAAQVTLKPATDLTAADLNATAPASGSASPVQQVEQKALEHPVISVGILLALFGIATILSSK